MYGIDSKRRALIAIPVATVLVLFAVTTPAAQVATGGTRLGDSGSKRSKTITGAWFSTITPTLLPPFVSLGTFTADGGITNTSSLSLGLPLESPGHGQWVRIGRDRYAVTFLTVSADSAGTHILTSKVRARLQLSADGDAFTGVFQVDVFDPNGVLLVSDTGTVRSNRIKVEPLP
jgi:hypothetical protein